MEEPEGTTIKCILCGEEFLFSDGERAFFVEKSFDPPKRCKTCRGPKERFEVCCEDFSELVRRKMIRIVSGVGLLVVHWGRQDTIPFRFCPFCSEAVSINNPSQE